jgi:DNA-binding NtrC family response regulator
MVSEKIMEKPRILLIDNNESFISLFQCLPETQAFTVISFTSPNEAMRFLEKESVDLVISDVQMPEMSGNELLSKVQDLSPDVPFILITAYGSSENAIQAVKQGAYHYFEKPIDSKLDLFWTTVREAIEKKKRLEEIESLKKEKSLRSNVIIPIIGQCDDIKKILQSIHEVADLAVTVLISGETGTGKELVAKAIHDLSSRKDNVFFPINCNAFSPGVLESELFGHEKGAFTGAMTQKKGLFEMADKGTLFLDEISDAPPALQSKLLRVIETRNFARVGGVRQVSSDFRVIAATNIDLESEVERGRFRKDLLYRLNVYPIEIPPLRKRKEDIPILTEYYFNHFKQTYNKRIEGISEKAILSLGLYDWPGNVRELVNVMERAVITCKERLITTRHLPFGPKESFGLSDFNLKEMEKFFISLALKQSNYNKTHAADLLGISRKTLIEKVKIYQFNDKRID